MGMSRLSHLGKSNGSDPIPSDVSPTAAVRGDAERGYPVDDDEIVSPGMDCNAEDGGKRSSSAEREIKGRHGKGLTEGDAGESTSSFLATW